MLIEVLQIEERGKKTAKPELDDFMTAGLILTEQLCICVLLMENTKMQC